MPVTGQLKYPLCAPSNRQAPPAAHDTVTHFDSFLQAELPNERASASAMAANPRPRWGSSGAGM
ncbi:hypothetical protein ABE85_18060 [Mitsuaria sp. 7]|nr:hypothetical protein ABE85_18060 [Mitsuaria sp. 7]